MRRTTVTMEYGEANDEFGTTVSVSGDGKIFAVGAIQSEREALSSEFFASDRLAGPGYVKLYEWDEASFDYKQLGDTLIGAESGDQFGFAISLSADGQTLAIGATELHTIKIGYRGYVKVYGWNETASTFTQLGETIYGEVAGGYFGSAVSLSAFGNILAVGSLKNEDSDEYASKAIVYVWNEYVWKKQGQSITGRAEDLFGWDVSLSGDGQTLAVGAPGNGARPGETEVYRWDKASGDYKQLGQTISGVQQGDGFGYSVSISEDGNSLAVGAYPSVNGVYGYVKAFDVEYGVSPASAPGLN